jgi:SMC interacting uncharacterized protein involved in chromosome segregation
MAELNKGQRVRIVGGVYSKYRTGTYIEKCGKVSCRVKVDGDKVQERTLRLTSIEPFLPSFSNGADSEYSGAKSTRSGQDKATRDEGTRDALIREIRSLKLTMQEKIESLEKQIKSINLND